MTRQPDPRYPGPYGKTLSSPRGCFFRKLLNIFLPLPTLAVLSAALLPPLLRSGNSSFLSFPSGELFLLWLTAEALYFLFALFWKAAALFWRSQPARVLAILSSFALFIFLFLLISRKLELPVSPLLACPGAMLCTLCFYYQTKKSRRDPARLIGEEFEKYCVKVLRRNGFRRVHRIGGSGDHGVDILCRKHFRLIAVQCKCYSGSVGNSAVQQVYTGKDLYNAQLAAVMTNSRLSAQAWQEAGHLGVLVWDKSCFEKNEFPLK